MALFDLKAVVGTVNEDSDGDVIPPWEDFSGAEWFIPEGVDVHHPRGDSYKWFTLEHNGMGGLDLEEVEGDVWEFGSSYPSPILQQEACESSWEDILDCLGCNFNDQRLTSALELGIAPGQPFLCRFGAPHYYRCSYEYNEWDVEYDSELLRITPWDAEQSASAWNHFLHARQTYLKFRDECKERLAREQWLAIEDMRIHVQLYCSGHYYRDTPPSGVRYNLHSKYQLRSTLQEDFQWEREPLPVYSGILTSGESDEGDHDEALQNLFEKANAMNPEITLDLIKGLKRRY